MKSPQRISLSYPRPKGRGLSALVNSDNPWQATTLEWATPTPPGHGNFTGPITVYRDPYSYSLDEAPKDYSPQWQEEI